MKRSIERFIKHLFVNVLKLFVVPQNIDPSDIQLKDIKKIVVILRHQMGDMLVALPMLYSLRDYFRTQHIVLFTRSSSNYHLLFTAEQSPVNEIIKYDYGLEKLIENIRALEYEEYDLAIIPSTTSFSSTNHLAAYLAKVKYRAGVSSIDGEPNPYARFLNIRKSFEWSRKKIHQVERNLDIIRNLNIPASQRYIKIFMNEDNKNYAKAFFEENFPDRTRPVIGFHPGAGKPENVWPPEKYAELADMLNNEYDPYFFISQGPKDKIWVDRLKELLSSKTFAVSAGVLLKDTALLSLLDLLITNDTGIMHIASGLDIPVIALFGPSKAYEWGPLGENKYSIQSRNRMMSGIQPGNVFGLCRQILDKKPEIR